VLALATGSARAQQPTAMGEVTKIDKAAGRVSIKHGEIKHLDMPPMTMAYRVKDPRLLDGLAVGNRISFTAERVNGQYTVTGITKAP
jgi:Cu/Ag efflux protein CusF